MPLYPYQCESCGHTMDVLQGMSEKPLKKCPQCKRMKLTKLFGVPNIIMRGIEHCKTVGQAAEENTRRLINQHGREVAETIINDKVYGAGGQQLKLPAGGVKIEKTEETEIPWWRSGEVNGTGEKSETPIDISAIKDPAAYIHTGEKS